jgi:hypothetical protein
MTKTKFISLVRHPERGTLTTYIDSEDWTSLYKYTFVSGDGSGAGGEWADLSANLPGDGTQFDQCAAQGGYDLVVKIQPGTGHVFIGGTNIWRSNFRIQDYCGYHQNRWLQDWYHAAIF